MDPQIINAQRWEQIIKSAYNDDDLRGVLASWLAANRVQLHTRCVADDGRRLYEVRLDRPHFEEVERGPGRKHWAVKA